MVTRLIFPIIAISSMVVSFIPFEKKIESAVLYTTCYPCPMCMGAILWAGIEKAYYCLNSKDVAEIGFNDDEFYSRIDDKQFLEKMYAEDTALRSECIQLLEDYVQSPHKMY